ncbi:MAG: signal peptidase I [Chloroflexi bacterium]|nr:signal peptidase I [Chloroflexota bacterium]
MALARRRRLVIGGLLASEVLVDHGSTEPGLRPDGLLLVNGLAARTEYHRGDLVVFESPWGGGPPLVKRIIALPADFIAIRDGAVFHSGRRISEPLPRRAGARRSRRTKQRSVCRPDTSLCSAITTANLAISAPSGPFPPACRPARSSRL